MAGKRTCEPPTLSDDVDFDEWEREIKIWQIATEVATSKQGARIYLSLQGKARENCKNIDVTSLEGDGGVKVLLKKLRELYAKDAAQVLFQTIEEFETYQRLPDMDIKDFLNEWERRHDRCKAKQAKWEDNVLAYKLLKAANLDKDKQLLIRATISGLTVEIVKKQIRAVFDTTASSTANNSNSYIKVEPTYFGEHYDSEEVYFSDGGMQFPRGRGNRRGGRSFSQNRGRSSSCGSPASRGSSPFHTPRSSSVPGQRRNWNQQTTNNNNNKRLNPPDRTGAPSRCAICGSVMHYAAYCPHRDDQQENAEDSIPTLFSN